MNGAVVSAGVCTVGIGVVGSSPGFRRALSSFILNSKIRGQ